MTVLYYRLRFILGICALLFTFPASQAQQLSSRRPTALPAVLRPVRVARPAAADRARGTSGSVVRPSQAMRYSWDAVGQQWVMPLRYAYSYDAAGRPTLTVSGDSAAGPGGTSLEQLRYDSRGNLVEQLIQERDDPTLPWANLLRILWTYDSRSNFTLIQDQIWQNNAWVTYGGYRIAYTYSSTGAKLEEVQEVLKQGIFGFSNRHTYTYDANNHSTSITDEVYENGGWVNNERIIDLVWYDWDAQWPTSYSQQLWNGTAWETDSKIRATWQPNGSFVSHQQYLINNAWQDYYRTTVVYDGQGNLVEDTFEEKPGTDWAINRSNRSALTYNAAGTSPQRRVDSQYDDQTGAYELYEKYYFSSFVTLASRAGSALSVAADLYPNPATTTVTLVADAPVGAKGTTPVEILNTLGQVVNRSEAQLQQGRLTATVDVSTLAAGVYTVRLLTPQGIVVRQLVRQ